MLKKLRKYRRIFYLLAIIVFVAITTSLHKNYVNTIVADLNVVVLDSAQARFITKSSVIDYLLKHVDYEIKGNTFKNIDLTELENLLRKYPFVKTAEVYRTNDDIVEIKVTQRKPILRYFDKNGNSFYIDKEGYILPMSKFYASYVPVYNGNIPHLDTLDNENVILNVNEEPLKKTVFYKIYTIEKSLMSNAFVETLIDEVYVENDENYLMYPRIGDYEIILGDTNDLEEKLEKLAAYYTVAAPAVGWQKYSKINLTYANQIVCTKK